MSSTTPLGAQPTRKSSADELLAIRTKCLEQHFKAMAKSQCLVADTRYQILSNSLITGRALLLTSKSRLLRREYRILKAQNKILNLEFMFIVKSELLGEQS